MMKGERDLLFCYLEARGKAADHWMFVHRRQQVSYCQFANPLSTFSAPWTDRISIGCGCRAQDSAPKWSPELASTSEQAVKADQDHNDSPKKLQEKTVGYLHNQD